MTPSDPSWLFSSGDNAWQLTAATLVGLMSLPGLAVLYAGIVQKKWAVNTMLMAFSGFSLVLVVWVLWGFKMGFGEPITLSWLPSWLPVNFLDNFVGHPRTVLGTNNQEIAWIPLLDGTMPGFRFSETTLVYFQFVFAAITPLLFLGSVIGRMNFKAWLIFVPLWSTFAYSINAFLVWGGGFWGHAGALDYSGGYVIHLAAGTSGFVAAWVIGPRLQRDRERAVPNNLPLAAVGAGILWLGWNGFNGGDPYFAGANASLAVLNTNLCTAVALLTWVLLDQFLSPQKKPTFLGAVNGLIVGLVGITPAAGFVNSFGAIIIGVVDCTIVWISWNYVARLKLFKKVDDTLGVFHTHGVAGLFGGVLVGVLADPNVVEYFGVGSTPNVTYAGWIYGHNFHQVIIQLGAAATIIVWDTIVTIVLLNLIKYVFRVKLQMPQDVLELGDVAAHDEEAYPDEALVTGRTDAVKTA